MAKGVNIMVAWVCAAALCSSVCAQWREEGLVSLPLEQALRLGNSSFVAKLQWYDVSEHEASGRILPTHTIWGRLPGAPIEIGRHRSTMPGQPSCLGQMRVGDCKEPNCGLPIMVISRNIEARAEILFVTHSYRWKNGEPLTDDLVAARVYEFASDGPELRRELIKVIADPDSTELLWMYALRRLYRLEDNHWDRIESLLHPQIQKSPRRGENEPGPWNYGRLEYATGLLIGEITIGAPDYRPPSDTDLGFVYTKLADVFEEAPTDYMAEVAINRFTEETTRRVRFSAPDWAGIWQRIRRALENPEHPIHKLPKNSPQRESVNQALERLFGEPNMLDTRIRNQAQE